MGSFEAQQPNYDVLIIGAGLSGCYACYKMRQLGVKIKVLETGASVGGTWFWSMYPVVHNFNVLRLLIGS